MRKIAYSRGRFIIENMASRVFFPFAICLFINLKNALFSPESLPIQAWISSLLSVTFFYSIYINFLKSAKTMRFSRGNLWFIGFIWACLSMVIHAAILIFFYHFKGSDLVKLYSFSPLNPWPFSLMALFLSPRLAAIFAKRWFF